MIFFDSATAPKESDYENNDADNNKYNRSGAIATVYKKIVVMVSGMNDYSNC